MSKYTCILPIVFLSPLMADVVTVSPDKLDFGSQFIGTYAYQQVNLTNSTKKPLNISSITAGNGFSVIYQDCGSVLAAGFQCNMFVQFFPASLGPLSATLSINDDANNSPQKVKLSGNSIPVQLISINVTPSNASAPLGLPQQFTAIGQFNDGSQRDLTPTAVWSSANAAVAISASGLETSSAQGTTTISATQSGVTGSTQLTITAPVLQSITVTPNGASIPKGLTQQFIAKGTLTNHLTVDLTSNAQWSSSAPSTVSVNATGLATGLNQGDTAISAASGGVTGSASVLVTPPVVTSLSVSPTNYSMGMFTNRQFTVTGTYSDSSTSDLTAAATWSSSNSTVATVNGSGLVSVTYSLGVAAIRAQVPDGTGSYLAQTGKLEVAFESGHMSLSSPRGGHAAALLNNGRVLLAGGFNASNQILASTDIFDPVGFITPGPPMNTPRELHTATALPGGKVLVAGGANVLSAELYDPIAQSFQFTGDLNVNRFSHTATLLNNGQVLIAGGNTATAELYDPVGGSFTFTSSMAVARTGHTATLLNDGRVLIAGGSASTMLELYDPATGQFTAAGTLSTDRSYQAAARLVDGRVLIVGGQSGLGYTASADLYDPATGTITAVAPMRSTRAFHTATLLSNGQVLVAGGYSGCCLAGPATKIERFDPTTGTFAGSGDMATYPTSGARADHTATLLENGQVLLAGNIPTGPDYPNGTAEIYQPSMPNPPGLQ